MRITEKQRCAEAIAGAMKAVPVDMPLKARKAALDRARPYWTRQTAHAEKSWQAARRDYLIPFGYEPMTKKAKANRAAGLPLFD